MDRERIARTLRTLRNERHETQEDVAKELKISTSAYGMYENGKRLPRDDVKIKISKHFGKPVAEIFF